MTEEHPEETLERRLEGLTLPPPPPPPRKEIGKAESNPEKNYDKLTIRLSLRMKVEFERICTTLERTPSAQGRMLLAQFIKEHRDMLE